MRNSPNTRTCVCCRAKMNKDLMTRVSKTKDGYKVDESGKAGGRGAYFCGSKKCALVLEKKSALSRSFKECVPKEVYDELLGKKED